MKILIKYLLIMLPAFIMIFVFAYANFFEDSNKNSTWEVLLFITLCLVNLVCNYYLIVPKKFKEHLRAVFFNND
ncbi:hypothetical protein AWU65_03765 [Paenibacillus glucanolyticus]|jgi:hypothetical protein|uniref:Uncharacterized protein n=1 Tax=Paenibacillus glucanolyticus TaxID=59843 RepID=A0A163GRA3_9BACL|nr:hypothetical protein AWU65_03765 [Paenibacillus glucanolyticus]OMF63862.1 hypothetical protein BK142_32485 [Paenibacillus glucanolyticus]